MRMVGPNCMGLLNADPSVRLNASFSPIFPPPRTHRPALAERRDRHRHPRAGDRTAARPVDLRQRRQQGRRLRQRPARILGAGSVDARPPALPRVVRQSPPLRTAGPPHRPHETDRRREVRAHRPRARAPRAVTRPRSPSATSTVDALFAQTGVIRADTLDEMFDVAACLDLQPLPAGPPRRDRHQRGRTRHPGGRCL